MSELEKKELFFDDQEIEAVENLKRVMNKPRLVSEKPVIVPEYPWEGISVAPGAVIYDTLQNKFRMWYETYYKSQSVQPVRGWAGPALRGAGYACGVGYAESEDGWSWNKPFLGRVEFDGSKENNLAIQGWCSPALASVIFQPEHPIPEKRYRLYAWDDIAVPDRHSIIGMTTYVSRNGFDWKGYEWPDEWCNDPQPFCYVKHVGTYRYPYSIGPGECNSIFFDERIGKYVNYCRANNGSVRSVGRMESEDGIHWGPPVLVLTPDLDDPFRTQFYKTNVMRCGEFILLLVHVYHMEDLGIDVQLAASREGYHFTRVGDRETFIERGEPGSFNGGMVSTAKPFEYNNELWIYTGGHKYDHGTEKNPGSVGLYKMRPDGYVSFNAGATEGSLVTRRFVWEYDELHLNAEAKDGELHVEVIDGCYNIEGGKTFEDVYPKGISQFTKDDCVPCSEDSLDHQIKFKNSNLRSLRGKYVQLRFYLRNAKFYSWGVK